MDRDGYRQDSIADIEKLNTERWQPSSKSLSEGKYSMMNILAFTKMKFQYGTTEYNERIVHCPQNYLWKFSILLCDE